MELWIRSQNKETLVKVEDLCIDNNEDNKEVFDIMQGCILLGTYNTKERALEILDEIQNLLQPKVIWKEPKTNINYDENFIQTLANDMVIQTTQQVEYDLKQAGQIVYEMPKE